MREVNFMVEWYPKMLRRRQFVKSQAAICAVILAGVLVHLGLTQHSLRKATAKANEISTDLSREQTRVEQLDKLLGLRQQLESRRAIVDSLGLPVEVSRVISQLAGAMGENTSLTRFEMNLHWKSINATDSLAVARDNADLRQQVALVQIMGVAPSTAEISQLYTNIDRWPFASNVSFPSSQEVMQGNVITREFSMSFEVPLTPCRPAKPEAGTR